MNRINELWNRFFTPERPIPAGVYHYQAPADAPAPYRLHLRLEPDGTGLLILNASTVLHLNQTAAEMAYYLIKQMPEPEVAAEFSKRYRVSKEQADQDYRSLKERLNTLINTPDLDPDVYLDFERVAPHGKELSAPLRIDCALTYRTSDGDHFASPTERVTRELRTEEWKTILSKAWDAGIPHVIFTGGEPTLRDDLDQLVAHSETLGMVAGLLTDGLRLSNHDYLHRLLQAGLDHLMICLDPEDDQAWEALRGVLVEDIYTTVHLTVDQGNAGEMEGLLERLSGMGVKSLSLSASTEALKGELQEMAHRATELGFTLTWDLPVPYSSYHPVALEVAEHEELPNGAGRAWIYVEPDGDVLPAQGQPFVMGNLLEDSWARIWQK